MSAERPTVLLLSTFSSAVEAALARDYRVVRWAEIEDRDAWLGTHAGTVRAVATGGSTGIENALAERLPNLGLVAINGVGYDRVDVAALRGRGVRISTTPDVLTDDVADLAVGLGIALFRRIPAADAHVRAGAWPHGGMPLARRFSGSRFGIVGLGRIGAAIAERLRAFGPVAYTGPHAKPVPYRYIDSLVALAEQIDVLVLAAPATATTRHMIDARVLAALGPSGCLINVARGSLVDQDALVSALAAGTLAGAALDVFADEPHVPSALAMLPNVVLTPHIGSATAETRQAMADLVVANLHAFATGARLPSELI